MKNPTSVILPVILVVVFFSGETLVFAAHAFFETCSVATSCGSQSINYPFFLHHDFCGFPGFQISCSGGNTLTVNISGDNYFIHRIDYAASSFVVSNAAFPPIADPGACIASFKRLYLTGTPYQLANGSGEETVILRRCNTTALGDDLYRYRIGCDAGAASTSVLAVLVGDENRLSRAREICGAETSVTVPLGRPVVGVGTRKVLSEGFELTWTASDCTWCNDTGGKCGFRYNTKHFQCFCPDRPHAARCDPPEDGKFKRNLGLGKSGPYVAAIIATICVVSGAALLLVVLKLKKIPLRGVIFFWSKSNKAHQNIEAFLRNHGPLQLTRYSYSDVKKMTKSFKQTLGKGGFGDVYKGKLRDGRLVAVKMLNHKKGDDGEGFINEVATISRTSHINIVPLLGFCFEGEKRALIYEFMPNGSLEKFVFDETITAKDSHHLNWEKHYQIALGIARGLEYLHRGCNIRIVHFDIKPHNILLDTDFVPKISDFGLAKICAKKESVISMLIPRGTIGYIAPEVFSRHFGEVSHKSDVYSFGMMVLEMVGRRRNLNVMAENTSEIYFPHWIHRMVELHEDLGLKNIVNEDDESKVRKMIVVSLWCIQTNPSNRPTMNKVIEMLSGSLDSLPIPPKPLLSSPSRSSPPHFSESKS